MAWPGAPRGGEASGTAAIRYLVTIGVRDREEIGGCRDELIREVVERGRRGVSVNGDGRVGGGWVGAAI